MQSSSKKSRLLGFLNRSDAKTKSAKEHGSGKTSSSAAGTARSSTMPMAVEGDVIYKRSTSFTDLPTTVQVMPSATAPANAATRTPPDKPHRKKKGSTAAVDGPPLSATLAHPRLTVSSSTVLERPRSMVVPNESAFYGVDVSHDYSLTAASTGTGNKTASSTSVSEVTATGRQGPVPAPRSSPHSVSSLGGASSVSSISDRKSHAGDSLATSGVVTNEMTGNGPTTAARQTAEGVQGGRGLPTAPPRTKRKAPPPPTTSRPVLVPAAIVAATTTSAAAPAPEVVARDHPDVTMAVRPQRRTCKFVAPPPPDYSPPPSASRGLVQRAAVDSGACDDVTPKVTLATQVNVTKRDSLASDCGQYISADEEERESWAADDVSAHVDDVTGTGGTVEIGELAMSVVSGMSDMTRRHVMQPQATSIDDDDERRRRKDSTSSSSSVVSSLSESEPEVELGGRQLPTATTTVADDDDEDQEATMRSRRSGGSGTSRDQDVVAWPEVGGVILADAKSTKNGGFSTRIEPEGACGEVFGGLRAGQRAAGGAEHEEDEAEKSSSDDDDVPDKDKVILLGSQSTATTIEVRQHLVDVRTPSQTADRCDSYSCNDDAKQHGKIIAGGDKGLSSSRKCAVTVEDQLHVSFSDDSDDERKIAVPLPRKKNDHLHADLEDYHHLQYGSKLKSEDQIAIGVEVKTEEQLKLRSASRHGADEPQVTRTVDRDVLQPRDDVVHVPLPVAKRREQLPSSVPVHDAVTVRQKLEEEVRVRYDSSSSSDADHSRSTQIPGRTVLAFSSQPEVGSDSQQRHEVTSAAAAAAASRQSSSNVVVGHQERRGQSEVVGEDAGSEDDDDVIQVPLPVAKRREQLQSIDTRNDRHDDRKQWRQQPETDDSDDDSGGESKLAAAMLITQQQRLPSVDSPGTQRSVSSSDSDRRRLEDRAATSTHVVKANSSSDDDEAAVVLPLPKRLDNQSTSQQQPPHTSERPEDLKESTHKVSVVTERRQPSRDDEDVISPSSRGAATVKSQTEAERAAAAVAAAAAAAAAAAGLDDSFSAIIHEHVESFLKSFDPSKATVPEDSSSDDDDVNGEDDDGSESDREAADDFSDITNDEDDDVDEEMQNVASAVDVSPTVAGRESGDKFYFGLHHAAEVASSSRKMVDAVEDDDDVVDEQSSNSSTSSSRCSSPVSPLGADEMTRRDSAAHTDIGRRSDVAASDSLPVGRRHVTVLMIGDDPMLPTKVAPAMTSSSASVVAADAAFGDDDDDTSGDDVTRNHETVNTSTRLLPTGDTTNNSIHSAVEEKRQTDDVMLDHTKSRPDSDEQQIKPHKKTFDVGVQAADIVTSPPVVDDVMHAASSGSPPSVGFLGLQLIERNMHKDEVMLKQQATMKKSTKSGTASASNTDDVIIDDDRRQNLELVTDSGRRHRLDQHHQPEDREEPGQRQPALTADQQEELLDSDQELQPVKLASASLLARRFEMLAAAAASSTSTSTASRRTSPSTRRSREQVLQQQEQQQPYLRMRSGGQQSDDDPLSALLDRDRCTDQSTPSSSLAMGAAAAGRGRRHSTDSPPALTFPTVRFNQQATEVAAAAAASSPAGTGKSGTTSSAVPVQTSTTSSGLQFVAKPKHVVLVQLSVDGDGSAAGSDVVLGKSGKELDQRKGVAPTTSSNSSSGYTVVSGEARRKISVGSDSSERSTAVGNTKLKSTNNIVSGGSVKWIKMNSTEGRRPSLDGGEVSSQRPTDDSRKRQPEQLQQDVVAASSSSAAAAVTSVDRVRRWSNIDDVGSTSVSSTTDPANRKGVTAAAATSSNRIASPAQPLVPPPSSTSKTASGRQKASDSAGGSYDADAAGQSKVVGVRSVIVVGRERSLSFDSILAADGDQDAAARHATRQSKVVGVASASSDNVSKSAAAGDVVKLASSAGRERSAAATGGGVRLQKGEKDNGSSANVQPPLNAAAGTGTSTRPPLPATAVNVTPARPSVASSTSSPTSSSAAVALAAEDGHAVGDEGVDEEEFAVKLARMRAKLRPNVARPASVSMRFTSDASATTR